MSFKVGQKVMAINKRENYATHLVYDYPELPPRKPVPLYEPLTIRSTHDDPNGRFGLRFEEIINPLLPPEFGGLEPCYCSSEFRPLVDISMFEKHLKEEELES